MEYLVSKKRKQQYENVDTHLMLFFTITTTHIKSTEIQAKVDSVPLGT